MRAALRETYQINLRHPDVGLSELADLVAWLPPGSALWRSTGGPASITTEAEELRTVEYRLRVLAWLQSEDAQKKRNRPDPPKPIEFAHEKANAQAKDDAKYAAHAARQAARAAR